MNDLEARPMIEISHLSKRFRISNSLLRRHDTYLKALDDITMTVNENEIVGLVGESGSGKTTLARVVLNLTASESEKLCVDGIDLNRAGAQEIKRLRREVAVVFQDPAANLNPRQTVGESIMRPMIIHGVKRHEARQRATQTLHKVKMDESYMDSYPHQLSGGQQQRIAIARALVLRPKIMILDEPTSALDISVQAQVLNLLLELQQELKLTYLVITHDLNVIRYISDRVFVMYLGKLVEYGGTEDVFCHPAHPYTEALMAAAPILHPTLRAPKSKRMTGEPGNLMQDSIGCRLADRCPHVMVRCREQMPLPREREAGHFAACHLLKGGDALQSALQ